LGFGGSPPTTTQRSKPTRRRKPSATTRPSAVEKEGSGLSPGYGNPTRMHAEESRAERSEEGGSGGHKSTPLGQTLGVTGTTTLTGNAIETRGYYKSDKEVIPRLRQSNSHARQRKPS
jgi:hypothetical protein